MNGGAAAPRLAIADVSKRYSDVVALDGVSLDLNAGQVLALLGPNGAGKSTLVSIVAGLLVPDAGTVRVDGHDPRAERSAVRRLLGVAPQEIGIYPTLTVAQNLRCFGELHGLGVGAARRRATELLAPFGLDLLAERAAGQLSGGQQRRLHTAIALVHRPTLVLLDEATAGADPQTRNAILDVILDLAHGGTAVLYTTHYLPEVERLGADVAVLERGRIIATGAVEALVAGHDSAALVLAFDGEVPSLAALRGAVATVDGVQLPCADPGAALRALLTELGDDAGRLRAVEIVQPSLEAVYLSLTGRRGAVHEVAS